MKRYEKSDRSELAYLFQGIDDSMVIAYLQGYMGEVFIKTSDEINAAVLVSGEYSVWGGDSSSADADYLAEHFFDGISKESSIAIFAGNNPDWERVLLRHKENHPVPVPRFHIAQRDYDFDIEQLTQYQNALPAGFALQPFDETIYHAAMSEEWSKEFCETFDSEEDYLKRGFGFAAMHNGMFVSGASTMTVYDGGAEIQVATREDYKQKGLALSCAAAIVLECVSRGIRPHWDAANEISKKMAVKLGYEYTGEYITIHMRR